MEFIATYLEIDMRLTYSSYASNLFVVFHFDHYFKNSTGRRTTEIELHNEMRIQRLFVNSIMFTSPFIYCTFCIMTITFPHQLSTLVVPETMVVGHHRIVQ